MQPLFMKAYFKLPYIRLSYLKLPALLLFIIQANRTLFLISGRMVLSLDLSSAVVCKTMVLFGTIFIHQRMISWLFPLLVRQWMKKDSFPQNLLHPSADDCLIIFSFRPLTDEKNCFPSKLLSFISRRSNTVYWVSSADENKS